MQSKVNTKKKGLLWKRIPPCSLWTYKNGVVDRLPDPDSYLESFEKTVACASWMRGKLYAYEEQEIE